MAGSRICMSKDINLTNSLLSAVHFVPLDGWAKTIQNTWFFIFSYFKQCRSISTEWILYLNVVGLSEWEGFGLEFFRMYPSLSLYITYITHTYNVVIWCESCFWWDAAKITPQPSDQMQQILWCLLIWATPFSYVLITSS